MPNALLFHLVLWWFGTSMSLCGEYSDLGEPLFLTDFIYAGNISEVSFSNES